MKFKFDIDDTILFSEIDKEGNYRLKSYDHFLIQKINNLFDKGHIIIIETGRHWNHLLITKMQLDQAKVKYHTLIMGKPPVDYDIDDKNISINEFMNREF